MISVTAKVNEDTHKRWQAAAGDKTLSAWLFQVVEEHLEREPIWRVMLEEQMAARYEQRNLIHEWASGKSVTAAGTKSIRDAANQKKSAMADEALGIPAKVRRSA